MKIKARKLRKSFLGERNRKISCFSIVFFSLLVQVFSFSALHAAGIQAVNRVSVATTSGVSYINLMNVDGLPPWEIKEWSVTAPDGDEQSIFMYNNGIVQYDYQQGTYYGAMDFSFNSTDGDYSSTLTDWDDTDYPSAVPASFSFNELPVVDITSADPADQGTVTTTNPTLSWTAVSDETTSPLYYQVEIRKMDEDIPYFLSDFNQLDNLTIPGAVLEDKHLYRWRVNTYDASTKETSSNVSFSDFQTFYIETVDNPPEVTMCRAQSRMKEDQDSQSRFVGVIENILPTEAMVLLKDPSGVIVHTFDMSNASSDGWFSWYPGNNNMPQVAYTFEAWENPDGTGEHYSTCTATFQPDFEFSPVEEIFAPDWETIVPTDTPTFSWMPTEGATKYRVSIMDYNWQGTVYTSTIAPETTVDIPAGYLKKNSAYRMRVTAYDGLGEERGNRADSGWHPFFVSEENVAPSHISGTVSLANPADYIPGTPIYVVAVTGHQSLYDGEEIGWTMIDDINDSYTLYNMPKNEDIYVFALWDKNNDGWISPDDRRGWYAPVFQLTETRDDINFTLGEVIASASISGDISVDHFEAAGHGPIYIGVFNDEDTDDDPVAVTPIAAPGPYTVTGLAAGVQYSVTALWDVDNSGVDDGPTPGDAEGSSASNPFVTVSGDNSGIDVSLEVGGVIYGTITDGSDPIANMHVYFQDASTWDYLGGTNTDDNGEYAYGLPPGSYHVTACPECPYPPLPYVGQIVENLSVAALDRIQTNFTLETGGLIEGYVRDESSNPLANTHVYVQDDANNINWIGGVNTDENGFYSFRLAPGSYVVNVDSSCETGYLGENSPDPVEVFEGRIEIVNFDLEVGAMISGTVDDGSDFLEDIQVNFQNDETGDWLHAPWTDDKGSYCSVVPPNQDYSVHACPSCNGHPYLDQTYFTSVSPSLGNPAVGIDFSLETGGIIEGTVSDDSDTPLPLANTHVYITNSETGSWVNGVDTDGYGFYSMMLSPGNYEVHVVSSCATGYLGATHFESVVVGGSGTETVDFVLEPGAEISGTISDADGPLPDIEVGFENSVTEVWVEGATTDGEGDYCTIVVPGQSYLVHALPSFDSQPFVDETYPSPVSPTLLAPEQGINFVLETGGTICGRITNGESGIFDIHVYLTESDTDDSAGGTYTESDGSYCIHVQPDKSYDVHACPSCDGHPYVDENYPGAVDVVGEANVDLNDIVLELPDGDGIDDQWELQYFDSLGVLTDNGDYDHDGYSDLQEYNNYNEGLTDENGDPFDPKLKNAPNGEGYKGAGFLSPIYMLLLTK